VVKNLDGRTVVAGRLPRGRKKPGRGQIRASLSRRRGPVGRIACEEPLEQGP
jgi:hypothetical protein